MKKRGKRYGTLAGLGIIIILVIGVLSISKDLSVTRIKAFWERLTEKKVVNIPLNKDTLYISSPVTSIDGKLTAINGNTITVTHHYVLSASVGDIPQDQKSKDVSFQFSVTPQTKIFRPPTFIPYLFKKEQDTSDQILQQNELKTGQFVMVQTNGDLQVTQSIPYQATSIQVTRIANNITGSITSVSGNTLTVTAPLPPFPASFPPQPPTLPQTYTVHLTPDTEISQREYNEGAPHQLNISSFTKGAPVAVYTAQDTGIEHTITALLITVFDRRPVPSISPAYGAPSADSQTP
ncbi:hypothetical protein M1271_07130 [Patescibacteria group bacterium]|nr:hypothetical protein [Patescibacteria group bacterium]